MQATENHVRCRNNFIVDNLRVSVSLTKNAKTSGQKTQKSPFQAFWLSKNQKVAKFCSNSLPKHLNGILTGVHVF